jgi:hypothetical protein
MREHEQDERERRFSAATGHWTSNLTQDQREQLARAKATLRRRQAELARADATLDRGDARDDREQTTVDRESADTARRESAAEKPDEPST